MKRAPLIAVALVVIYFLLSFNAYACLLPLYGNVQVAKGPDCAMPQEQPVRDNCDAFKTIGVQMLSSVQQLPDFHFQGAADELVSILILASVLSRHYDRSGQPPFLERDLLSLTSILRI